MQLLVVCSIRDSVSRAQVEPFIYNRRSLCRQIGSSVTIVQAETLLEMEEACKKYDSDVVFLMPFWRENASDVERVVRSIREDKPNRKIIFVDPFAQVSSDYFRVLPYVDRFLKRQCLKDLSQYEQQFAGGMPFTNFLVKQWRYELDNWAVSSEVPANYADRIGVGWNLGTAKKMKQALFKQSFWPFKRVPAKNIDIFCRLSVGSQRQKEWYHQYRMAAVDALEPLRANYHVAAKAGFADSGETVSRRKYKQEMKQSRLVFSPFGWGETCWRDFEAICNDCLLVKPSVAHIATEPNVFVEGQTYVPVKWDLTDLEQQCRYYLEHPDEAAQIVRNARSVFMKYFQKQEFVKTIAQSIGL